MSAVHGDPIGYVVAEFVGAQPIELGGSFIFPTEAEAAGEALGWAALAEKRHGPETYRACAVVPLGGESAETSTGGAQEPAGAAGIAIGSPASNSSSSTAQKPNASSMPGVAGTLPYDRLAKANENLGNALDAMAEAIRDAIRAAETTGPAAGVALLRGYAEEADLLDEVSADA